MKIVNKKEFYVEKQKIDKEYMSYLGKRKQPSRIMYDTFNSISDFIEEFDFDTKSGSMLSVNMRRTK